MLHGGRTTSPRHGRAKAAGIATGILFGIASYALAHYAGSKEPIASGIGHDGRATLVAILVAGAGIAGGLRDHGSPLPDNISANTLLRAQHQSSFLEIVEANRRRVAEYRVTLTIDVREVR